MKWTPVKFPTLSCSTLLLNLWLSCIAPGFWSAPAQANCSGEEINGICFVSDGDGLLERSPDRLDQIQQSSTLQLTVELAEEMEVAIAVPQLTAGSSDPNGTQLQASLSAQGSSVDSTTGQAITLPANQPITLTLAMNVTRPDIFTPDNYGYDVPLSFVPTAVGGTTTEYEATFAGMVDTACLTDDVNGGTLALTGWRSLSSSVPEGIAGQIINLRCNADVNVGAVTTAIASSPSVTTFASCQVALQAEPPMSCDGSATTVVNQASFPLANAEVHLNLVNYQDAPGLPAGSYEYVVTLTVTP